MADPHTIHVIIPTGGRPETITATLRSCAFQNYDNLVVWICDNSFSPETAEAVSKIADSRFRLIQPDKRLCMAENWEFALSHIQNGFVTIIGDDDCLMPNSITRVARLIEKYPDISIFNHLPASYYWPDFPDGELANRLFIRPTNFAEEKKSCRDILGDVCLFRSWYGNLPLLYHGFVSAKLISTIKAKSDGIFFRFSAPDIYAAIALAMHSDQFLMLNTPLTIGGQSAKSNGANYYIGSEVGKMFTSELPDWLRWRYESMSISLAVYEALENAMAAFPMQASLLTLDRKALLYQSVSEVKSLKSQHIDQLREKLIMIYPEQVVDKAIKQINLASRSSDLSVGRTNTPFLNYPKRILQRVKSLLTNKNKERLLNRISASEEKGETRENLYIEDGFLKLDKHIDVSIHGVESIDSASHFLQAELERALLASTGRIE